MYNRPADDAGPDELDILDQVRLVEEQLAVIGIDTFRKALGRNIFDEIEEVKTARPDFVFNLVESINNKGRLIYFAPALLALERLPYTGCSLESVFLTSNKLLTSKILETAGIKTPGAIPANMVSQMHYGRKYIIKPLWEDGSLGIGPGSVFTFSPGDEDRIMNLDPGNWFVEPFIDGREFNISILSGSSGPVVLPPAEIEFRDYGERPRIVDFKAKWDTESFEYRNTVRVFPEDLKGTSLGERLTHTCLRCREILDLKGYARVDIRCDNYDNIFVLEVNANPCISPDSGFIAACQAGGLSTAEVIRHIIDDLNT